MDKINILIVDDDPDWIKLIKNVLLREEDISIADAATTGAEAISKCKSIKNIDVVLMDINLSGPFDGIDIMKKILEFRGLKVVMLTCLDEREVIVKSVRVGALDYVLKSNIKILPQAIRGVYSNTTAISVVQKELARLKYEEFKHRLLSKEEKRIVDLREEGMSINQIARITGKAERTIKNQFNYLYKRFQASDFNDLQILFKKSID